MSILEEKKDSIDQSFNVHVMITSELHVLITIEESLIQKGENHIVKNIVQIDIETNEEIHMKDQDTKRGQDMRKDQGLKRGLGMTTDHDMMIDQDTMTEEMRESKF